MALGGSYFSGTHQDPVTKVSPLPDLVTKALSSGPQGWRNPTRSSPHFPTRVREDSRCTELFPQLHVTPPYESVFSLGTRWFTGERSNF